MVDRPAPAPKYPDTGPASTIACPRHGLAVALGHDGRIVSTCPACVRVAERVLDQWKDARKWSARPRLLDLFCCEGGAATGYHRAGFDVVGVDIEPQPRYPFEFVQADALNYLRDLYERPLRVWYDVIHASPPCQLWADGTPDRSIHRDLIAPVRELLIATGLPYVIENVRAAPLRDRVMICGGGLGLTVARWQLHRHRYFESNVPLIGIPCTRTRLETISVVGHGTPSGMRKPGRPDPTMADRRAVMEMPWASRHGTSEAIPPRYTEHLGWQLIAAL